MDIEYEIAKEGYELFYDEPPCDPWIPWSPDPNEVYPLVLENPD